MVKKTKTKIYKIILFFKHLTGVCHILKHML